MDLIVKSSGSLFIVGLIALSYGASQQNSTYVVIGVAVMVISVIAGFLGRKMDKS